MSLIRPFHYQVSWQPRAWRPGEHAASVNGDGGAFRGERLLADASQARFLSVRASIRDPLRRLWVKEHQQRATIDVFVVADISRSMRIGGDGSYCHAVGDLTASAALSAYRGGDRIGVVCASARVDPHLVVAPTRRVQPVFALAQRIRDMAGQASAGQPGLASVDGLLDAWRRLSTRRSLVLVVSDYHAPSATWIRIFETLRHHHVVPVVMQDPLSMPALPRWGLVSLDDAESGRGRTLFMRPSLQRRLTTGLEQRRTELSAMFESLGLRPAYLRQPFEPEQLTDYFHAAGLAKLANEAQEMNRASGAGATAGTRGSRTPPPPRGPASWPGAGAAAAPR